MNDRSVRKEARGASTYNLSEREELKNITNVINTFQFSKNRKVYNSHSTDTNT